MLDKGIRIELEESSSNIKYFLIKWLQEFGSSESVEKSVIDISATLGVSKDVVTKATAYLTANGYFEKKTVLTTKRWSRCSFKCSSKLKNELDNLGEGKASHHVALIKHLMVNDIQKRGGKEVKRHSLDLSPRLLLIILLRNANECGVVDTLGLADLAKLTGLSKVSVKARIEHLLKRGYIRSYISGVTGRHIYHRSPGVFYINLKHPNYALDQKTGLTTCIQSNTIGKNPVEARAMYTIAKQILTMNRNEHTSNESMLKLESNFRDRLFFSLPLKDYIELASFFDDQLMYSKVREFMQAKIDSYASKLLSEQWYALFEGRIVESDLMKKRIARDTFGKKFDEASEAGIFPSKQQKEGLVNFLFETSVSLAKRMQGQLSKITKVNLGKMNHVILPAPNSNDFRLLVGIDSFDKVDDKSNRNKYIKVNADYVEPLKATIAKEYEISLEEEHLYGLLTEPEKKIFSVGGKTITL